MILCQRKNTKKRMGREVRGDHLIESGTLRNACSPLWGNWSSRKCTVEIPV